MKKRGIRLNGTILPQTPHPAGCVPFHHIILVLDLEPQVENTLSILNNLVTTELALSVQTVDKGNRNLGDSAAHGLGTHHQLHLETVSLALGAGNGLLKGSTLIETETACEVAHTRTKDSVSEQVGATADELALEIPAKDTTVSCVSSTCNNVVVALLLEGNHLGDELGVVREVGIHDDNEVAGNELETVDIGRSETEFASAGFEEDVGRVGLDELLGDFLGSIGGSVVDNDEFPIEVATSVSFSVNQLWTQNFTDFSVKVRFNNQVMIGRFLRSLYVGKITEYLFPLGAMMAELQRGIDWKK